MALQGTVTLLKTVSAVLIGFGLLTALAAVPALSRPTAQFIDLAFWPVDGGQSAVASETRLLSAIAGGMLAGWGILFRLLSTRLLPREPALARTLILSSIGAWFIVDCAGSVAAGAPLNAVLNVGFLLAFVIPLWRPVRRATPALFPQTKLSPRP